MISRFLNPSCKQWGVLSFQLECSLCHLIISPVIKFLFGKDFSVLEEGMADISFWILIFD